ncbi:ABC-2 transporter permease [Lacrimispora sp.]|uniref:ABC-2 transporter permease n=1 Tax=Lacrimispora sp. TaxID=2719234 RepID=UPI0028B018CE|nr:ABC-2 transporter permease [Lacrimispora sp.]
MSGLMIKDLYNIKGAIKLYTIIMVCLIAYCVFTNKGFVIPIVPIIIGSTILTSTFRIDSKVKWTKYIVQSPLSKKDIIISKYLLLIILIVISSVIGILFSIPNLISNRISMQALGQLSLMGINIALCSGTLLTSVNYLFGEATEKIEIFTILSYAVSTATILGIYKLIKVISDFSFINIGVSALIINVVICLILWSITIKIYQAKEISLQNVSQ